MLRLGLPPHSRWTRGPDQTQHFAWVPLQEAPRHVTPWIPDHSYSLSTVPSLRSPLRRHCLEPSSPFGPPWSIHLWGGSTRRTLRGRHHRSRSLSQPRQGAFGTGCIWRGPPPPHCPCYLPFPSTTLEDRNRSSHSPSPLALATPCLLWLKTCSHSLATPRQLTTFQYPLN